MGLITLAAKLGYMALGSLLTLLALVGIALVTDPGPVDAGLDSPTSAPQASTTPWPTPTPRPPTRTPDATKEMEKSVSAAAYILEWEHKVEFWHLCDALSTKQRIWDWEKELERFEIRVAEGDYAGTVKWHQDIRRLATELESLVGVIDRDCLQ